MSCCKYCGAEIEWLHMPDGRFIPADPKPVFAIEGEGSERFYDDEKGVIVGRQARPEEVQTEEQKFDTPLYFAPHWKTCSRMRR